MALFRERENKPPAVNRATLWAFARLFAANPCLAAWTPDAKAPLDEGHPLNALKRERSAKDMAEMDSKLPLEKLIRRINA